MISPRGRLVATAWLSFFLAACGRQHVVLGVGDIAVCDSPWDEATARLTDSLRGIRARAGGEVVVITAGDNVYPRGTAEQYRNCHAPAWGQRALLSVMRPAPGNHDYLADGTAGPYFAYFGERAGPPGLGYYSYQVGPWHLISLNSEIRGPAAAAQLAWLRSDLAQYRGTRCTLAYWHKPVFSSGAHGNDSTMFDAWRLLYQMRADVVVTGHDHTYERFGLQDPAGAPEPDRGVQEFVVGTGGAGPYQFTHLGQAPNSAFRNTGDYGVLMLELMKGRYRWQFVTIAGRVLDSGSLTCR